MKKINEQEARTIDGGKTLYYTAVCDCGKRYGKARTMAGIWTNLGLRFHSCATCNASKARNIGYFCIISYYE